MQQLFFRAMGCQMMAALDVTARDAAEADAALAQVPAWFEAWEQSLSRFRPDSELSRLNVNAGRWTPVSETLWAVLVDGLWAAAWSAGLVTPTLLRALQRAGYDRSFDAMTRSTIAASQWGALVSAAATPSAPQPPTDWRDIKLDIERRAVRTPPDMQLDLGGVAKGWAAEQSARRLGAVAPSLVDAGGDICASRAMIDGLPWPISIADPFEPERDLELLAVHAGCVATSGRDYRRWERDGQAMHHLIDPRTGAPAHTDVVSASVIAPSAREAETAAKAALILGSADGLAWLSDCGLPGLLVLENGDVVHGGEFEKHVWG